RPPPALGRKAGEGLSPHDALGLGQPLDGGVRLPGDPAAPAASALLYRYAGVCGRTCGRASPSAPRRRRGRLVRPRLPLAALAVCLQRAGQRRPGPGPRLVSWLSSRSTALLPVLGAPTTRGAKGAFVPRFRSGAPGPCRRSGRRASARPAWGLRRRVPPERE